MDPAAKNLFLRFDEEGGRGRISIFTCYIFGGRQQCGVWMYLCGGGGEEIDPADDPARRSSAETSSKIRYFGGGFRQD